MDIFLILFFAGISFLCGVIATLVIQYYILYSYFQTSPKVQPPERHNSVDYCLPTSIKKQLENEEVNDKFNQSSLPISLILQFLFHELRHSESIKRWLYKKLSLEFEELLTKTTIGKFFETISIKDMDLGSQFPDIKEIKLDEVKLSKNEEHIEFVSVSVNLDYTGNFLLSIDAKMKFGKTAYLSIRVKKVSGLARLQFTRHPYTHWSFSFYNEPIIELAVESHFQGRQLQSNITNLIMNQIKRSIKRKHTLPNYKIRYKPFFVKTDPSQLDAEDVEIVPQGQLEVSFLEVSRIATPPNVKNIYCSICVDAIPWICVYQNEDSVRMILEITMTKLRQTQLGVIFRQEQGLVVVENVSPHSCASRSGLKAGDIVLAVENKIVNSVPQVAKFIKSVSSSNITLRVERYVNSYVLKWKSMVDKSDTKASDNEDNELVQIEQDSFILVENAKKDGAEIVKKTKCLANLERLKSSDRLPKIIQSNENMSKIAQTIGSFSLRKRKSSLSERNSNDGSAKNTPTSSGPGTPQHTAFKTNVSMGALCNKKHSISEIPEIIRNDQDSSSIDLMNVIEIVRSKEVDIGIPLQFNEDFQFTLKEGFKYLNVNVWGTIPNEKDLLLGYINIPLSHILNECCNSVLGHYLRSYSFLPPNNTQPTSQSHPLLAHSGFEHVFCYGDILLSFIWCHDDDIELKRRTSTINLDADTKLNKITSSSKHDFIRTQFHRTTHCDFCSKKIWLKDAVQCRQCGLCCHKKCIAKCQMNSSCLSGSMKNDNSEFVQPEIVMSEVCDDDTNEPNVVLQNENSLKRVNSVNNLAIPGSSASSVVSKSLPPTPQRKHSLVSLNPFALCPNALDELQKQPNEGSEFVRRLLEQVMLCPADEFLMDAAKETGQQLYSNVPHDEKLEKINLMMAELKKTLDVVTAEHMELSKQMSNEESEEEKTRLAFLIGQADAKVHGLSVLMLHYCSSLQHSQEKIV